MKPRYPGDFERIIDLEACTFAKVLDEVGAATDDTQQESIYC